MGEVYPRVGLDCVGLGQKFFTFNESGWDGSNCKKCVTVCQYNFYCISPLFASFFVGSGFVPELVACSMSASPNVHSIHDHN